MRSATDELYLALGSMFGILLGLASFVGSWWYCVYTYGYLLGFGLGWLPSAILATIVFLALRYLWALFVTVIIYLFFPSIMEFLGSESVKGFLSETLFVLIGLALIALVPIGVDLLRGTWGKPDVDKKGIEEQSET